MNIIMYENTKQKDSRFNEKMTVVVGEKPRSTAVFVTNVKSYIRPSF